MGLSRDRPFLLSPRPLLQFLSGVHKQHLMHNPSIVFTDAKTTKWKKLLDDLDPETYWSLSLVNISHSALSPSTREPCAGADGIP